MKEKSMVTTGNKSMAGKVAFVTGGGSGIGRATVIALAREGASVAIGYVTKENAEETARMVAALGGKSIIVKCDVQKEDEIKAAIEKTIKTFGRLDYGVNNAGAEGARHKVADYPVALWDKVIDIDLKGVFLCMKYEIPQMLKQSGGSIVNISSGAGITGFPDMGAYVAAKHGVVGLTKTAALDYAANNIRFNAVCAGITETPMISRHASRTAGGMKELIADEPIGRLGKPEEIAASVLWLCSDASSFVTGAAIPVDGGQTAD
jgi:NAD(P)-dependent dehydrogenase (short-subunit alcohol dehydrogenase family)